MYRLVLAGALALAAPSAASGQRVAAVPPAWAAAAPTPVPAPRRLRPAFTLGGAAVGAIAVLAVMVPKCGGGCGGGGSYLAIGAVGGAYTGAMWGGFAGRLVDRTRERQAAARARAREMGTPDA